MHRRIGLSLWVALIVLMSVMAVPAHALCLEEPFRAVLGRSHDVWWATVTEAEVAPRDPPGTWLLTVDIVDPLKGDASDEGAGVVAFSRCQPFMDREQLEEAAGHLVGQTMLFIGNERNGTLAAYGGQLSPSMQPDEQYAEALAILGQVAPTDTPPVAPVASDTSDPLPIPAVVLVGLLIAGAIVALVRRRRTMSRSQGPWCLGLTRRTDRGGPRPSGPRG